MTRGHRSLSDITVRLRAIDVCMLVTKTGQHGHIAARPMSNNQDVSSDRATTYHFASDDGRLYDDIQRSKQCGATYSQGGFYASVQGTARLIHDRTTMEEHWRPGLETWFDGGLDNPDIVLIEVAPLRISWWESREHGELTL